MSLVLLAGALLFVRSLQKLLAVDPGFRPEGIVAVSVDYRAAHFPKERITEVRRQTLEKLRVRTGAISAGQVDMTPVSGSGWDQNAWADGSAGPRDRRHVQPRRPRLFPDDGDAFVAGRDFDEHDNLTAPKVAIVNEEFARTIFHGRESGGPNVPPGGVGRQARHAISGGGAGAEHEILRTTRGLPADCVRAGGSG